MLHDILVRGGRNVIARFWGVQTREGSRNSTNNHLTSFESTLTKKQNLFEENTFAPGGGHRCRYPPPHRHYAARCSTVTARKTAWNKLRRTNIHVKKRRNLTCSQKLLTPDLSTNMNVWTSSRSHFVSIVCLSTSDLKKAPVRKNTVFFSERSLIKRSQIYVKQ